MSVIAGALLTLCSDCDPRGLSGEGNQGDKDHDRRAKLVEALADLPLSGMNVGPVRAIGANRVTDAVVCEGAAIVPMLASALDRSSYGQTVWIVFCLTELRATPAKARVIKLKHEEEHGRFAAELHDFTLEFEIKNYLRVVAEAEKERKK
ncbi:MAG TPA: hypothetical protein VG055_27095 [Planctomycetaceae bacterium]|nr:hypothetical protein [Planctomycetaceae bacterium]